MTTLQPLMPPLQGEGRNLDRTRVLAGLRDYINREKELVYHLHKEGASGRDIAGRLAQLTDAVVAFAHSYAEQGREKTPVAWIATGGYGRGELNPYSDIDLMLFHRGAPSGQLEHVMHTVIELLWDSGLLFSHSCRTPKECLKVMEEDPVTASALLEGRLVAGDDVLMQGFRQEVLVPFFSRHLTSFIAGRLEEAFARHTSRGMSPYLIEPNLKENPGGLRDVHLLLWIKNLSALLPNQVGLIPILKEEEHRSLLEASDLLLRIRTQLHLISGRRYDILERALQEDTAQALGYHEEDGLPAATSLMRGYFTAVARVCYLLRTTAGRFEVLRPCLGHAPPTRRPLGQDLVAIGRQLYFAREDGLDTPWKAKKMMELFFLAQRHHLEPSPQALRLIHDHLWLVDEGFRNDPEIAEMFMGVLKGTRDVCLVLSHMRDCGFLGQYIPEFGDLVGFVHYESYHTHTVDEHTLQAIKAVDDLWHSEGPDTVQKRRLLEETGSQSILRLALLLHDIGKPRGAQHPLLGAAMIPAVSKRLCLGEADAKLLQFLVENHLEMTHLFERRDYGDEPALTALAHRLGDPKTLRLLYLLTYADIRASGPWFSWQDSLLWELYQKMAIILSESRVAEPGRPLAFKEEFLELARTQGLEKEAMRHCELVPPRYILEVSPQEALVHLGLIMGLKEAPLCLHVSEADSFLEVWICTEDRPARFSQLSGVFASKGISIISAQAYTRRDGIILDLFRVVGPEGQPLTQAVSMEIKNDLLGVLKGEKSLVDMLRSRQRRVVPGRRPGMKTPTTVYVDNKSSPDYTIIDVVSPDRVGLLYTISLCLAECGLDIHFAKVATRLDQAIDVFYVTSKDRRTKLFEEEIKQVRQSLIEACKESNDNESV